MPATTITDVRTIGITVTNQDEALAFFVDTLGFEKRLDAPISPTMRWVEVAPPGANTSIALNAAEAQRPISAQTLAYASPFPMRPRNMQPCGSAESTSATCCAGTTSRPCSRFDDPDGNRFYIVEESS